MKEKSLFAAKNRFAADTVSYIIVVTDFRKNTRLLIRYLILRMKGTSQLSSLFGRTVKMLTWKQPSMSVKLLRIYYDKCKQFQVMQSQCMTKKSLNGATTTRKSWEICNFRSSMKWPLKLWSTWTSTQKCLKKKRKMKIVEKWQGKAKILTKNKSLNWTQKGKM